MTCRSLSDVLIPGTSIINYSFTVTKLPISSYERRPLVIDKPPASFFARRRQSVPCSNPTLASGIALSTGGRGVTTLVIGNFTSPHRSISLGKSLRRNRSRFWISPQILTTAGETRKQMTHHSA